MNVYLDSNATTRPDPRVVDAMGRMLAEQWHNPSSIHRQGQAARQKVELARHALAKLINTLPRTLILTSGATESISIAFRGMLMALPPEKRTIITTPVEHEAIRDLAIALEHDANRPIEIRRMPVDANGVVNPDDLPALLDDSVALVSVQWANNETGAIQPIEPIGAMCREKGVVFHTDATQWVGKMPVDVSAAPIDLLSLSAHKFHGPKGSGALYVRPRLPLKTVIHGSQERGRRGGTENTAGVVGMGVAAEVAMEWLADPGARQEVARRRDRFEQSILERVPDTRVNGPTEPGARLYNTSNLGFAGVESEALLLMLSERDLCASAGAACGSGSLEPSPILQAMGVPVAYAQGSVRFSLCRETTDAEVDEAIRVIPECVERLRSADANSPATVGA